MKSILVSFQVQNKYGFVKGHCTLECGALTVAAVGQIVDRLQEIVRKEPNCGEVGKPTILNIVRLDD